MSNRVLLAALALTALALLCWAYRRRVARVEPSIPFTRPAWSVAVYPQKTVSYGGTWTC